jgi:hypothetical protein
MTCLWRKHVLPLGTVPFGNWVLDFTPAYLDGIAAAFHLEGTPPRG